MRLFIATPVPDSISATLEALRLEVEDRAPNARWVDPRARHLTLKFLGETPEDRMRLVDDRLRSIQAASFSISVAGVGFFPNERAPRVFWVGIRSEGLMQLAGTIEQLMIDLDFDAERRGFHPHLTLARGPKHGRLPATLVESASQYRDHPFGAFEADRFVLYESRLHRSGATYRTVGEYPLQPAIDDDRE